jgi:hypothetical protein
LLHALCSLPYALCPLLFALPIRHCIPIGMSAALPYAPCSMLDAPCALLILNKT